MDPDTEQKVLKDVSDALVRRGFLTSEWWTTVFGAGLSAALALIHVKASSATHVVAVVAPALLAALYAITRTMHKSALASALSDLFPQAASASGEAQPGQPQTTTAAAGAPTTTAVTQTDPDFTFEGIPPIEESDG